MVVRFKRFMHRSICNLNIPPPPHPSPATTLAFELFDFWRSHSRPPVPKSCSNAPHVRPFGGGGQILLRLQIDRYIMSSYFFIFDKYTEWCSTPLQSLMNCIPHLSRLCPTVHYRVLPTSHHFLNKHVLFLLLHS